MQLTFRSQIRSSFPVLLGVERCHRMSLRCLAVAAAISNVTRAPTSHTTSLLRKGRTSLMSWHQPCFGWVPAASCACVWHVGAVKETAVAKLSAMLFFHVCGWQHLPNEQSGRRMSQASTLHSGWIKNQKSTTKPCRQLYYMSNTSFCYFLRGVAVFPAHRSTLHLSKSCVRLATAASCCVVSNFPVASQRSNCKENQKTEAQLVETGQVREPKQESSKPSTHGAVLLLRPAVSI